MSLIYHEQMSGLRSINYIIIISAGSTQLDMSRPCLALSILNQHVPPILTRSPLHLVKRLPTMRLAVRGRRSRTFRPRKATVLRALRPARHLSLSLTIQASIYLSVILLVRLGTSGGNLRALAAWIAASCCCCRAVGEERGFPPEDSRLP